MTALNYLSIIIDIKSINIRTNKNSTEKGKYMIKKIWYNWMPKKVKQKIMLLVIEELTTPVKWVDSVNEYGESVTVRTLKKRVSLL